MQNYSPYRRAAHRSRRAPQSDDIVIALTAQVLVCIVLLLAAVIAKQMDEPAWKNVKTQYDDMANAPADGENPFAGMADLGGSLQEVFSAIEKWISSLIGQFGSAPQLPQSGDEAQENSRSPESLPQSPATPTWDFGYDYLDADEIVRVTRASTSLLPLASAGRAAPQAAPEGSTYAAVEVAGNPHPPLTGLITSPFAYREHPLSGNEDFHTGLDIAAAEGRAVLAVLPGVVKEVGESDIYGHYITLQHAPNFVTFYAHCSEIIAAEGMQVRQGERIARVGHTGMATGPHLHFSVLVDGVYTDPYWVLRENIRPVGE